MIRPHLPAFLAALSLLLLPSPAAAWWEYGHETTAEVAMKLVQPRTRQSILWLLKQQKTLETPTCPARTIEQASVWPDCIKTLGDRFSYAYAWHFQDVEICKSFDLKEPCAGGNCVSAQIARAASGVTSWNRMYEVTRSTLLSANLVSSARRCAKWTGTPISTARLWA